MTGEESTGRTELLNGFQIYFELRGSGEPLLLLHGFSGSSQNWTDAATKALEGFQLIVPDLRGHGRSGILTAPFRHQDAASDVAALLEHLGISSCKGLGISGGGNILLHVATRRPGLMTAMVLVSSTPYFPAQARPIMRRYADDLSVPSGTSCARLIRTETPKSMPSFRAPKPSRKAMTT